MWNELIWTLLWQRDESIIRFLNKQSELLSLILRRADETDKHHQPSFGAGSRGCGGDIRSCGGRTAARRWRTRVATPCRDDRPRRGGQVGGCGEPRRWRKRCSDTLLRSAPRCCAACSAQRCHWSRSRCRPPETEASFPIAWGCGRRTVGLGPIVGRLALFSGPRSTLL